MTFGNIFDGDDIESGIYVCRYPPVQEIDNDLSRRCGLPITRPDPGPDGVLNTSDDTGRSLTYFEYDAALRPASFSITTPVNDPTANGVYKAAEIALTKRSTR